LVVDPRRFVDAADRCVRNSTVHRYGDRFTSAVDEPGRAVILEPVIRLLMLKAIHERLPKKTELVVDAVAEAGHIHRCERIEEAGCQPAESSVAEGCVVLE